MNQSDLTAHDHPRNDLALAEAALFLAPQPLTRRALAKILGGVAQAYVDQLLVDLKTQFEDIGRGIELHIEDGRAQFRVKTAYINEVAHLAPQHDIPRQELRTLAVIAYNHPMTQANLIKVRGNKGYKHVQELIERNLITSEPYGRTCLLHVTRDFLRHFGLSSVEEFRFHFPTAAEENAEALARPTHSDDDTDDETTEVSRADGESQSFDEHALALTNADVVASDKPGQEDREDLDIPEPEASDKGVNALGSDTETDSANSDTEDEPDEESPEEVEHG
ncbi:SMC-Scp complex subunit ScpB [Candidatus Bipolaricaulota bacterium]|nr:SMC-Scp complex subunit ScpB [Candidatus Bipolaricaulota bacterium]